jgi:anti-anti-sigma regulatory factor
MRILKPPRLSRTFGRSSPGALCEPFTVTTTFEGDRCVVVAVAGDIDLATVGILVECVETAVRAGGVVVVDLAAVPFCSGVGFLALRRLQRQADEAAVPVAWVVPGSRVWRLLRGAGFAAFSCHRDRAAAHAAVG